MKDCGIKIHVKKDKIIEVRKAIMTDMRGLAALFIEFKNMWKLLNFSDMFQRCNFEFFETALQNYTSEVSNDGFIKVKLGLKIGVYYLIKKASNIIKATLLMDDNEEGAK